MADIKTMTFSFKPVCSVIDQFAVFENNYKGSDVEFNINSNIKFEYDVPSRTLRCQTSAEVNQQDRIVVVVMVTMGYELEEKTVKCLTNANRITLPSELIAFFGSKTYGAMRGVLLARLEPTQVRFILPFIDINQIVRSSVEFDVNQ